MQAGAGHHIYRVRAGVDKALRVALECPIPFSVRASSFAVCCSYVNVVQNKPLKPVTPIYPPAPRSELVLPDRKPMLPG